VNDLKNPRIQKFDSNGHFIKQWGFAGIGEGQFTLPLEHLMVDALGNIWMVDGNGNPRVQKFDGNGNFIAGVGSGPCYIAREI
jgi:tripartite motif-containing protein 71